MTSPSGGKRMKKSMNDLEMPPTSVTSRNGSYVTSNGPRTSPMSQVQSANHSYPHRKMSSTWGSSAWMQILDQEEGAGYVTHGSDDVAQPSSDVANNKPNNKVYCYSPTLPASQERISYTTSVTTFSSPRRRMSLKAPNFSQRGTLNSIRETKPTMQPNTTSMPKRGHEAFISNIQLTTLPEKLDESSDGVHIPTPIMTPDHSSPTPAKDVSKNDPSNIPPPRLSIDTRKSSYSEQQEGNGNEPTTKDTNNKSPSPKHRRNSTSFRERFHSRRLTETANWLLGRLKQPQDGKKGPPKKAPVGHRTKKPENNIEKFHTAQGYTRERTVRQGFADDAVVLARDSKPDPQAITIPGVSYAIKGMVILNLILAIIYMQWRWSKTIEPLREERLFNANFLPALPWGYTFFFVEVTLIIAVAVGHTQRLFPVQRKIVTMDQLSEYDATIAYNAKICILIPTAGESMETYLYCIMGAMSQFMWPSPLTCSEQLKIIILDEKRRREILHMTAAVYALCTMLRSPSIIDILTRELVEYITVQTFHKWWKDGGYARKWLFDDPWLNKACLILEYLVKKIIIDDSLGSLFNLSDMPKDVSLTDGEERFEVQELVSSIHEALNIEKEEGRLKPAYTHMFDSNPDLPTVIYYTRREAGTPKASPKDFPGTPPLIGDSNLICINDCRHKLHPMFLQRTLPYFFKTSDGTNSYAWDTVAFVQTPQRFTQENNTDDPLGNNATIQFDVINRGKDGIAAVSSAGHGSVWRVEALRGKSATGEAYCDINNRSEVGNELGFRAQLLIEDTHTSIDMFRYGWGSRYVNEPGEWLSSCSKQPDSLQWRIKQVLRWHQIYAFDQATYYLQAFPGFILTIMPIIYGLSGVSPFSTELADFFIHFTPYIITASLPTVYAFLSMLKAHLCCKSTDNAWATKIPRWPLFALFVGQIVAVGGALYWVSVYGFTAYSKNFSAVFVSAALVGNALWPMISMQLGLSVPFAYYVKLLGWIVLTIIVVVIDKIGKD